MSAWEWRAARLGDNTYGLACGRTRDEVIANALRETVPGEQFEIVEAQMRDARKYEGSDFVPFIRERNHEVLTNGPAG